MNLHRTSKQPDWEKIAEHERTFFQKIAFTTKGIVTPANAITVIGLLIVIVGLVYIIHGNYWTGLLLLAIGRLLDIVDGVVADKTGTKSMTGEFFDAAADKLGTVATIASIIFIAIADWWILVALIVPQIIIPLVILYKKRQSIHVHTTRQGKLSMVFTWVGIVSILVSAATENPIVLTIIIYVSALLAVTLGLYALWQYATGRD